MDRAVGGLSATSRTPRIACGLAFDRMAFETDFVFRTWFDFIGITRMTAPGGLVRASERLTLACTCETEVLVPMIIMLPRHHVVRILKRGATCHGLDHVPGHRAVVRWELKEGRRIVKDIHAR
jgi:hypothetical protein